MKCNIDKLRNISETLSRHTTSNAIKIINTLAYSGYYESVHYSFTYMHMQIHTQIQLYNVKNA